MDKAIDLLKSLEYVVLQKEKGRSLVLFPSEMTLMFVSDTLFDYIDGRRTYVKTKTKKDTLEKIKNDVSLLRKWRYLKKDSEYPWQKVEILPRSKHCFSGMVLNVSHRCNLSCSYCYASGGSFNMTDCPPFMSLSVAKKACDWFLEQKKANKEPAIIHFSGGEPFLNKKVLYKTVEYLREKEKHVSFAIYIHIGTNGTFLKEKGVRDFIVRNNLKIYVSLDVSPDLHNSSRKYRNGRPSYEDILEGLLRLRKHSADVPILIESVVNEDDDLNYLCKFRKDSGIRDFNLSHRFDYTSEDVSFKSIVKKIESFLRNEKDMNFFDHSFISRVFTGQKALEICAYGYKYTLVTPDGGLHSCGINLGKKDTEIGDVENGLSSKFDEFISNIVQVQRKRRETCLGCWARRYCYGPCRFSKESPSVKKGENLRCDLLRVNVKNDLVKMSQMREDEIISMWTSSVTHKYTDMKRKLETYFLGRQVKNDMLYYFKIVAPL